MSIEDYKGEAKKWQDASCFPSYTRLTIPYRVLCRQRYQKSGVIHRKQFTKEHARIEMLQPRALDSVRIHKEFCECVLQPPTKKDLITLTPKQQARLTYILENDIV